jgi:hypothetical protein
LMPQALDWLATAEQCFADEYGSLRQGLLTSVFSLVVGLGRIFHLEEMEDAGFARLCGGRRCPSRYTVGAWRRHLPWFEVDAFCRRTCPWHLLHNEDVLMSFDEHSIPRWTRKFHIGKGYVTTRNKYMRKTVHRLRPRQRPFPERARHAGRLQFARTGGAAGATGVASGPATQLACSV